jgi:RNA polymerase sigma-70 factor (ECF subfamily)
MSTGLGDNEIISKVLKGEQNAYAELVNRYQAYVFTLVPAMIKSREDAEEVAQDVFIKAYRSLADFRGESKFSTWLYTIANTPSITFLRKKKLDVHSLDNEKFLKSPIVRIQVSGQTLVEQKSRVNMVNEAIPMLSPMMLRS